MNKLKFLLFGTMLCAIANPLSAQNDAVIRGKVLDKTTNGPVGWATVALMKNDSTIITGASCDANGEYEIKASAGQYTLSASLIGYKTASCGIDAKNGVNSVEPILLETDTEMLEGAKVTERVKLVEMKIDKVVVNVSQSAFAQTSDALELLKKSPGVTIDKDGNVKLNGKTVSVWIDGRPSYLDGKSLESLLRSTGGTTIEKIELMEHPSSKYDAAGQGGIINIKTKRNFLQGFNGSVGAKGGAMYFKEIDRLPWEESAWANISYRTKKTNTFLNIYEGISQDPLMIVNDLEIAEAQFNQLGNTLMIDRSGRWNFKLGNDWFIDKKNTVGAIVSLPRYLNEFNSVWSTNRQTMGNELREESVSSIKNGPSYRNQNSVNLNWTHTFNEMLSREITTNIDWYHNSAPDNNSQEDTVKTFAGKPETHYVKQAMHVDNIYDIYSAKTDYQGVIWNRFMLETGAKWALSNTDNKSIETRTDTPDINTEFVYKEHIGAAYVSLAGQLGKKWSFKGGLRGEYTYSLGDWISSGAKTQRDYFDIFPTAYLGYQPTEKWRLSASLTRRIGRPSYYQINPAKMYIDSKTYTIGQPDILPQYNTSIALTAGRGMHYSLSFIYDRTKNVINQIPTYSTDGTQYLTWGNYGTIQMGALALNISALPLTKWMEWTLSANELYVDTRSDVNGNNYTCWSTQWYTDLTFTLPKDWKIDIDGQGQTPMRFGCYYIHSSWMSNLAVKKNLLDGKVILSAGVNDLFRSFSNNIDIYDESGIGAVTRLQQLYYMQRVTFGVTWNFGKAQQPLRQRNVGNLEEASRAGGSKGVSK